MRIQLAEVISQNFDTLTPNNEIFTLAKDLRKDPSKSVQYFVKPLNLPIEDLSVADMGSNYENLLLTSEMSQTEGLISDFGDEQPKKLASFPDPTDTELP